MDGLGRGRLALVRARMGLYGGIAMRLHALILTLLIAGCAAADVHTIDRVIGGGCTLERVVETETENARRVEIDCH